MLTTKTLLLLIFVNIILILMPLPVLPGVSSNVFGTLIYLLPILFWLLNIRNSVLLPELLPELEKTEFHLDEQPYASLFNNPLDYNTTF